MSEKPYSNAVITAIRERQEKLRAELPIQRSVADAARAEATAREAIVEQTRSELIELAQHLAAYSSESEADTHLHQSSLLEMSDVAPHVPAPQSTQIKASVADATFRLLQGGKQLLTKEILAYLEQLGLAPNVQSPASRISQILSNDPRFVSERGVGWKIKGETPATTGVSV